ncbi:hypothetical protein [Sphingorhabdus sp.]|uniref:hypothetical protein n=1 Tax=Sphingorhabdus sp. TaxID=1902408 RepID=UPI0037C95096
MIAATAVQTEAIIVGYASIFLGVSLFIWGVTIDGVQWWRRFVPSRSKPVGVIPISLDDAIRYIGYQSKWGMSQDRGDHNFAVRLAVALKDKLASGDLQARGRYYHALKGGIADPPYHARIPIEAEFWQKVDVNVWWALNNTSQLVCGRRITDAVPSGGHEGRHDIILDKNRLEMLWPRG